MATRHQVRQAVISLLYANEMGSAGSEFVDEFLEEKKIRNERKNDVTSIFKEILAKQDEIDATIKANLKDGDIQKVGLIEKNILRLGIYEIFYLNIERPIIINEAVELAKELCGDSSPRFVNGVLANIKQLG